MRSKLPRVREMTTQTDHSFLSDVHPERKATSGIQRYVEHDAYAGALWQPTDADQEDSCMVRMNTPISCLQNDKVTTSDVILRKSASLQGYKVASALRTVLWETIQYGRSLYGRPCHDLGSFFSAVRFYICINDVVGTILVCMGWPTAHNLCLQHAFTRQSPATLRTCLV
jgi:hypothetical protein